MYRRRYVVLLCCSLLACFMASAGGAPLIIAHRGASGYLPEHTLEAYAMAYAMGADYIEPDLVLTKDREIIVLHDLHLEPTTDVEEQHPDRKHEDGHWYAADFTLAEIKALRVHERLAGRFPVGAAAFEVPTLQEMIELVQGLNTTTGRNVGIYPELKQPQWHRDHQLPLEEKALEMLTRYGYSGPEAKCFVQCFEPDTLKRLRIEFHSALPLIQLISTQAQQTSLLTEAGLDGVAEYANGIGPDKKLIEANPALVAWAHQRKLQVHPYTFRKDDTPAAYASYEEELTKFVMEYRVDGFFTDHTDAARNVLLSLR